MTDVTKPERPQIATHNLNLGCGIQNKETHKRHQQIEIAELPRQNNAVFTHGRIRDDGLRHLLHDEPGRITNRAEEASDPAVISKSPRPGLWATGNGGRRKTPSASVPGVGSESEISISDHVAMVRCGGWGGGEGEGDRKIKDETKTHNEMGSMTVKVTRGTVGNDDAMMKMRRKTRDEPSVFVATMCQAKFRRVTPMWQRDVPARCWR